MAVDRSILDAHETGGAPPTLRLYRWSRPTVSLGRFQKVTDVDASFCAAEGIDLCRRPTGGRGVLHDDEITYSIVAGVRDGIPRGVSASHRLLCGALVEAYRELGVAAELTGRPRGERAGACYLHATDADLSLGAAKLSGSAQVWSGSSCLQHGSFVISRDVAREASVFRLDASGAQALDRATETIVGALGRRPADAEIVSAIVTGFARALSVRLEKADLTMAETAGANDLLDGFRLGGI
jgi:lipoate-protein ligase A